MSENSSVTKPKGRVAQFFENRGFITKIQHDVPWSKVYQFSPDFSLEERSNIKDARRTKEQLKTGHYSDLTNFDTVEYYNYQLTNLGRAVTTGLSSIIMAGVTYASYLALVPHP